MPERLRQHRQRDDERERATPQEVADAGLRTPARPLETTTRLTMEERFGHDFSQVRVHTDDQAAEAADGVNARAYTVGRDLVFGPGEYAPGSGAGEQLLAHLRQLGAVRPDQPCRHALEKIETGPPDQRAIAEHPEVVGRMRNRLVHAGARRQLTGSAGSARLTGRWRVRNRQDTVRRVLIVP